MPCTTVLAGKLATNDRSTMIARTDDGHFDVKKLIPVKTTYKPNPANKEVYDRNFKVFKNLYKANKENFAILNG